MLKYLISILALICILPASSAGDGDVRIGSAGINGNVASYIELRVNGDVSREPVRQTPCWSTVENIVTLEEPVMMGYAKLDASGNIIWRKWMRLVSQEVSYEHDVPAADIPVILETMTKEQEHEFYFFYDSEERDYPSIIMETDTDGKPLYYITLYPADTGSLRFRGHVPGHSDVFTDRYEYRKDAIIMTRESDGKVDHTQTYHLSRDGKRLVGSEMADADGFVNNITKYDNSSQTRGMTTFLKGEDGKVTSYSYKFKHSGKGEYIVTHMSMRRGKHPYYSTVTYGRKNGLMVWQESVTAAQPYRVRMGRNKPPREISVNFISLTYNSQGDLTSMTNLSNENGWARASTLYDRNDNWYLQLYETVSGPSITLRAFLNETNED